MMLVPKETRAGSTLRASMVFLIRLRRALAPHLPIMKMARARRILRPRSTPSLDAQAMVPSRTFCPEKIVSSSFIGGMILLVFKKSVNT